MNDTILLFLSNALTAIASFFVGKRKSKAETDNLVLSNLEKSMSIYQDLIQNLKDEIHELKKVINDLEITNKKLNEEIRIENIETYKNDKFIDKILDTEKIVSANIDSTESPIENTIVSDRTEKKTNKSTKKIW